MQRKAAVTDNFLSNQLLLFVFAVYSLRVATRLVINVDFSISMSFFI